MRLSPTQAAAVRYLLQLPGTTTPARTTIDSLRRAGVIVGADTRCRLAPEHRAAHCTAGGLTASEAVAVEAALARDGGFTITPALRRSPPLSSATRWPNATSPRRRAASMMRSYFCGAAP